MMEVGGRRFRPNDAPMGAYHGPRSVANAAEQDNAEDAADARPRHAQTVQTELQRALAISQEQTELARGRLQVSARTIADLQQKLQGLAQQAYHDELTGLPNRRLLLDRLNQAMAQAARQHRQLLLVLIDLDGFKIVNDKFGHATGDRLLQQVAWRLTGCIRSCDTVCRYGGDEFVVMLPELAGEVRLATVVNRIRACLATQYVLDGEVVFVTASIGTAVYRGDKQNYHDLIRQADLTMYRAKTRRNGGPDSPEPGLCSGALASDDCDAPSSRQSESRTAAG